ncbi:hypothetical protein AYI68_g1720 [Smittium mucronatum]|uniref:Uncharacterized protein n=1 Tax=Smittium mucronatum TaxID=133383 RepID=A0A1R0H4J6_9FUNG|nr:hypothetical protein AYI68_g1720 [Smittium mucronatum]
MQEERPALFNSEDNSAISGITISEPSEYQPIAKEIAKCLSETGKALIKAGYYDFSNLVIKTVESSGVFLDSGESVDGSSGASVMRPVASELVRVLVNTLPVLRDGFVPQPNRIIANKDQTAGVSMDPVYFFCGSQRIVNDLYVKFSKKHPKLFGFVDVEDLCILEPEFDFAIIEQEWRIDPSRLKDSFTSTKNKTQLSLECFNLVRAFYVCLKE